MGKLALGIDSSTQSITAVVFNPDTEEVKSFSLNYREDPRLSGFGINADHIVPPRVEGEADQPPEMIFASIDALCEELVNSNIPLEEIGVINVSGQQHGHVYLNSSAQRHFHALGGVNPSSNLVGLLNHSLAYGTAPIWMTSNTEAQSDHLMEAVGGEEAVIKLSGSASPLRFTGAIMRRVGEQFPYEYEATERILLISNLIPAILAGNTNVPVDFGNASGMTLMNYRNKVWSQKLLRAAAKGLPGGEKGLRSKLPPIVHPQEIVGYVANYFVEKYGFDPQCKIVAGSGDNPQTKVLVAGDLLSLGTSFVNMVGTDGRITYDMTGIATSMYDGLGRPFLFGCRTNGAMVWDKIRAEHSLGKDEYAPAEDALARISATDITDGNAMLFHQPQEESFPDSRAHHELTRIGYDSPDLGRDFNAIVNSTLAAVYLHSLGFTRQTDEPLYVAGGASRSPEIMRRVAAIWKRPVIPVAVGAGLGAAIAGADAAGFIQDVGSMCRTLISKGFPIAPREEDVRLFHKDNGFLNTYQRMESKVLGI